VTVERPGEPDLRPPTRGSADHLDTLRFLAETGAVIAPPRDTTRGIDSQGLDVRTAALARLAALIALRAAPATYRRTLDGALAAGASVDDVVDTLKVVARTVGLARVVSAAPGLALAVGYDIDDALEALDELPPDDPPPDDARGLIRVGGGRSHRRGATEGPEDRLSDPPA
jgi:alkylhydroperoxidase/carboxymuconolactone decarboxylase family protein YurZ